MKQWPPCQPTPTFCPVLPLDHAGTDGIDVAADLVAWDTRVLQPRHHALFHQDVAVADAAGMHLDPDLPSGGCGISRSTISNGAQVWAPAQLSYEPWEFLGDNFGIGTAGLSLGKNQCSR